MADRPILFSAPMIRALLAGTKTQTRRLLKPQPSKPWDGLFHDRGRWWTGDSLTGEAIETLRVPYAHGDRLWVREAHYLTDDGDTEYALFPADEGGEIAEHLEQIARMERDYPNPEHWAKHKRLRPSIHMPRWASRLTLTVTEVRVQQLQEISEADVLAEGCPCDPDYHDTTADGSNPHMVRLEAWRWTSPRAWYHRLWDAINGPGSWDANPWVVAVSFEVSNSR